MLAQPIAKLIAVNASVQVAHADEYVALAQLDKGTRDLLSGVAQALRVNLLEELLKVKPAPRCASPGSTHGRGCSRCGANCRTCAIS
jgi:hypothetical protein